jgi:outer membrane protein OmpA-like peptidoglycan-associated protein
MRKLAIAMALASTAIASPALARDKSWYIGAEGGAMVVEDITFNLTRGTGPTAAPGTATVDHDYGYDVGGLVGYDFGVFRLEAEVAYKKADLEAYESTLGVPVSAGGTALANVRYTNAGGSSSALSFMVNGLLDFGDEDGISGYIGGGAGVARVKFSNYSINPGFDFLDDSDTRFAWQGIAGVRAPLTDNIDVGLKYRFFNASRLRVVGTTGDAVDGRFRSHSLLGTLTYNFGAPAAPPPPPPTPPPPPPPPTPPPPPPPAVGCTPGPDIVFFEGDKSDITPEAASILDTAVSAYQNCGNAQVMLAGYTDTSGTPRYNLGLSQRRADSVKAYMTSHGIADGVITTQAFGETNLRVQTADGVRELQNRRVEITYGPGSGM